MLASSLLVLFGLVARLAAAPCRFSENEPFNLDDIEDNYQEPDLPYNPNEPDTNVLTLFRYLKQQSQIIENHQERWLFNFLTMEKQARNSYSTAYKFISFIKYCPQQQLIACIKNLINNYFQALRVGPQGNRQTAIKAFNKYFNNEITKHLINNSWLSSTAVTIEAAVNSIKTLSNFRPDTNLASLARTVLQESFGIKLDKDPHESIWYFLNHIDIIENSCSVNLLILETLAVSQVVLTENIYISTILNMQTAQREWIKYQIDKGLFSRLTEGMIEIILKDNVSLTGIWTKTSFAILNEKNAIELLNNMMPPEFPIGSTPKYRLCELDLRRATNIIKLRGITDVYQMYATFILGVNISCSLDPMYNLLFVNYESKVLDDLSKWLNGIWELTNVSISDRDAMIKWQLYTPYLNILELFTQGIFNEEYAKTIANNDLIALEMIEMLKVENCNCFNIVTPFTPFDIADGKNWNEMVINSFRLLLSRTILACAEDNGELKRKLMDYFGFDYSKLDCKWFAQMDKLKTYHNTYLSAYTTLEKWANTHSKEKLPKFNSSMVYLNSKRLPRSLPTFDYCIEHLRIILSVKMGKSPIPTRINDDEFIKELVNDIDTVQYYFLPYLVRSRQLPLHDQNNSFIVACVSIVAGASDTYSLDLIEGVKFYRLLELEADPLVKPVIHFLKSANNRFQDMSTINSFMSELEESFHESKSFLAICHSLNLKLFKKTTIKKFIEDAISDDTLSFPIAFWWHLLAAQFDENLFNWKVFYQESGLFDLSNLINEKSLLYYIRKANINRSKPAYSKTPSSCHSDYYTQEFSQYLKDSSNPFTKQFDSNDIEKREKVGHCKEMSNPSCLLNSNNENIFDESKIDDLVDGANLSSNHMESSDDNDNNNNNLGSSLDFFMQFVNYCS